MSDFVRLGSDTGSLVNYIHGNSRQADDPKVGDPATICGWSDRHAATVIEVFNYRGSKMVTVQQDHSKRIDSNGFSEDQEYEYSPNPDGPKRTYKFKSGRWVSVGPDPITRKGWQEGNGYGRLALGFREEYYDYSF